MKRVVVLLFLAACGNPPASTIPTTPATSMSTAPCPTCPRCPETPEPAAPTCPEPSPRFAENWHCHDLHRPKMDVSGFCRPSAFACEHNRIDLTKRKIGKPGPCVTQPTAFCFPMYNPANMTRQRMCARTMDNCQARREWASDNRGKNTTLVGQCSALRNIERFAFEDEVPLDQLPPPSPTP